MNFTVHLTENCNMACSYCLREKTPRDMSLETLYKTIDLAYSKGNKAGFCFFGGEPLLKKDLIYEALDYCEKKTSETGIPFACKMTTNGTLIDEEFLKRAKAVNMKIGLSFDGKGTKIGSSMFPAFKKYYIPETADVYNVKWEAAAAPASKIFLESNDNKTYYAKFYAAAKTSISKGKGDVVVYEAYADGSDIYMDPLYSINDKYVVALGQAVIVKVKGTSSLIKEEDGKKYIECEGAAAADLVTQRYLAGADALANKLGWEDHETNQVINGYANAANNEAAYAVAKISTNGLKFQAISNEGTFYLNKCIYIIAKKSASGVRVIWLDEEDATAIKNVKAAKAENGAIYNLAGQKVNAAYKGVVIKDGKKYIQK